MSAMASRITSLTIVYSTVSSDADQRKHQSSASLAFVLGIHRGPVNSPHKWPVTRKIFPFHDFSMSHNTENIVSNMSSWMAITATRRLLVTTKIAFMTNFPFPAKFANVTILICSWYYLIFKISAHELDDILSSLHVFDRLHIKQKWGWWQ